MTRLIALYPRAWRDRYESEFLALVSERPSTAGDHLDIVRGAIDARLHTELPATMERSPGPSSRGNRTGLLSVIAGLGWLAWIGVSIWGFRPWGSGVPDSASVMIALSGVGFLALAIAAVAIVVTFERSMRAIGVLGGVLTSVGFGLTALGGGLTIVIGLAGVVLLALSLGGRVIPWWVAAGWIGTSVLVFAGFMAFLAGDGKDAGLIALGVPFGFAWIIAGAAIAARGTPVARAAGTPQV